MPGNPIPEPTKDLKQSGFTYTQEEGWGNPPVSAAPKAVFDASNPAFSNLGQTMGHIRVTNGSQYEVVTTPDGEKAFNYAVGGNPSAYGDTRLELNYDILVDTFETYHHFIWRQPDNFYHRKCVGLNGDLTEAQNWVKGDVITSSDGFSGKFYSYETDTNDGDVITVENYGGQFSQNWSGKTITNQRTGESFVSTDSHLIGSNNKLFHEWVDGQYGYPNGSLKIEFDAVGGGDSKIKSTRSARYSSAEKTEIVNGEEVADLIGETGSFSNEIPGQESNPLIFETVDNGFDVEFVIGRKRSTDVNNQDASEELWKKVNRSGSPYEQWTKIFMKTGISDWADNDQGTPNAPTKGTIFGAANSGYEEDTSFLIKYWGYWTQKPTFLP